MSSSTVVPSDSTTLHDANHTLPRSSEEEKSTRAPVGMEGEGDECTAVAEESPNVNFDGGWQAWGVVVGVSSSHR